MTAPETAPAPEQPHEPPAMAPGSLEAQHHGCTCPVIPNLRVTAQAEFLRDPGCRLHGAL